jgi:hypothetical protein
MKTITKALPIFSLTLLLNSLVAQTIDAAPVIKPRFALSVTFPAVIKPTSEVLLETKVTNISNEDLYNATEFQQREINSINYRTPMVSRYRHF